MQAWEQASLMEEMWTEENAQLREALEVRSRSTASNHCLVVNDVQLDCC